MIIFLEVISGGKTLKSVGTSCTNFMALPKNEYSLSTQCLWNEAKDKLKQTHPRPFSWEEKGDYILLMIMIIFLEVISGGKTLKSVGTSCTNFMALPKNECSISFIFIIMILMIRLIAYQYY
jgi:hypothetical protein